LHCTYDENKKLNFRYNTTGRFTFWLSLSLRLSPSPKSGLRLKTSQKVKSLFSCELSNHSVISQDQSLDRAIAESKVNMRHVFTFSMQDTVRRNLW